MGVGLVVSKTVVPLRSTLDELVQLVSEACRKVLPDNDARWRLTMAAHELAENLLKYSAGGQVTMELEFDGPTDAQMLVLRTRNRANPDQIREAQDCLRELRAAADPAQYYEELIQRTAYRENGSGLGLARIAGELGLQLGYEVTGDHFTLRVQLPVTAEPT